MTNPSSSQSLRSPAELREIAAARGIAATLPHAELHLIPTLPAVFVQPTLVGEVYRRFLLPEG